MSFLQASWRGVRLTMVAAALVLSGQAMAQQPSQAALKTAAEITRLTGANELFAPLIPGVIEQARLFFVQQDPTMTNDATEIANQLRKDYEPRLQEVYSKVVEIYASHFTEQELKDLVAFYKSTLGQKLLSTEPKAIQMSMAYMNQWAQSFADQVSGEFRAEMRKRGKQM